MVNANHFARSLIERNICMDMEQFVEQAISHVLANDMKQAIFREVIELFNSFENIDDTYCINLQGAWLKYALNGEHDSDKLSFKNLIRDILGKDYSENDQNEMIEDTPHHLQKAKNGQLEMIEDTPHHLQKAKNNIPKISDDMYRQLNWINSDALGDLIEDNSDDRKYMIVECQRQRSNNSWHSVKMLILRPKDFIHIMNKSRCINEYSTYFTNSARHHPEYFFYFHARIHITRNRSSLRL